MTGQRRRGIVPWLYFSHRSFFIAIMFEATGLLWLFVEIFFGGHEQQWDTSLQYVNTVMSPQTWGIVAGFIGGGLLVGLYRENFVRERRFLNLAFWFIALDFVLLAIARVMGEPTGASLQVRWALLGNLFVQWAFEPPENPSSE